MPKSNTVNRMHREREWSTRERESRYTGRRKMGRDGKRGSRKWPTGVNKSEEEDDAGEE